MKWSAAFAVALALSVAAPAYAVQSSGCDTPSGYVSLNTLADLPPVLQERFQGFEMPDGTVKDASSTPPSEGIASIWHRGRRWILEEIVNGDIVSHTDILAFYVSHDGKTAEPLPPMGTRYCVAVREYARML